MSDDWGDDDEDVVEPAAIEVPVLLPWQTAPLRGLLAQRERNHHATLLHGPAGTGLRRFALRFAQGLLCRAPAGDLACGHCDACHLFLSGGHPDWRLLVRTYARKKDGEPRLRDEIVIAQVRTVLDEFLYLTSHRQGAKVVVIYLAEELNNNAANALLKSLEEPPPATYFILASHRLRLLAPTVISRCRHVPVPQPAAGEAAAWLRDQHVADPVSVLAQAGDAPLRALAMADPDYQAERRRFLQRLADPRRLSIAAMGAELESGPRALRKARLQAWVDWLTTWSYDLAAMATLAAAAPGTAAQPRYHLDFAGPLSALASQVAPLAILRYHRTLLEDRALLSHPLNPRLVAENALFGYRMAMG